ncbi:hypothetical protein BDV95DRAFT_508581 [Massariosphaeria phaeospora]|uniref:Secreted protein n=1 Tax=Massariosphaeria phaeospora TaxID=100035 RepID=A0A7C8HYB3_9PLEO|nr:hypothetical protein BDV95DRAFT_508581 [Massariosphaeria phaeospora]
MRSTLLLAAVAPALALAAPEQAPRITAVKISGSGCPNDSNSVKSNSANLGDNASFSFSNLRGDDTNNCQIHLQSTGGSQGWQVAVREVAYEGNVVLKAGSQLDAITQVFWSEKASDTSVITGHLTCAGPDINNYVTIRQSTNDLSWSKCTASDGNPGILNVNFRPVVQGNAGTFDFKHANWKLEWRRC